MKNIATIGEQTIKELQAHLRQKAFEIAGWQERPASEKEALRHKWAVEFLQDRGVLGEYRDETNE